MWVFPTDRININSLITYGSSWNSIVLSNAVPPGTNAVLLHIRNTGTSSYNIGVRPSFSSWDILDPTGGGRMRVYGVRLNAYRIFQGYFPNSVLDVAVIAYSDDGTFLSSPVTLTCSSPNVYQSFNLGSYLDPECTGAAFFTVGETSISSGYRPGGTSYDMYNFSHCPLVGLNSPKVVEIKVSDTTYESHLWGGFKGFGYLSSPQSFSPSAGSWATLSLSSYVPSYAIAAVFQVYNSSSSTVYGFNARKTGSSDNITTSIGISPQRQIWVPVGLNSSLQCDVYRTSTSVLVYLIGYIVHIPASQFQMII